MLHKINQVCGNEFTWVGNFQRTLLEYACRDSTSPVDIEESKLFALLSDVDQDWFSSVVEKKDNVTKSKKTLLENLQIIAAASLSQKQLILSIYDNNQKIKPLYDDPCHHKIKKITELSSSVLEMAYRGYLSTFYDPLFNRKGYEISSVDFDRKAFLEKFDGVNNTSVCVFCDMDLNDPDIDHFFSKKEFPELSCHSSNLIPICKSCNGRARKGEKAPLDFNETLQCQHWYHPYHRQIDWSEVSVDFKLEARQICPYLRSNNPATQTRLDKLNNLLRIDERWKKKLRPLVSTTIKQLRKKGVSQIQLKNELFEMSESRKCEIGELSSAILATYFLKAAASGNPHFINEIEETLY